MSYKFLSTILGIDANFTGSVGVGTTTPTTKLDVLGGFKLYSGGASPSSHYIEAISPTTSSTYLNLVRNAGAAGTYAYYLNNGVAYLSVDNGTGETRLWANNGGYYLTFFSNGLERMRIPTTGNLLIGTTTDAGFKLDVNGTAVFRGATQYAADVSLNNNRLYIGALNGNTVLRPVSTTNLQLFNNNTGATLFLDANGAVQIGQSSAVTWAYFTASGNTLYNTTTLPSLAGTGTRMVVADATGILSTQAVPTGTVTGSGTTNYISKWTSSSGLGNSLVYDNGTNVGIGTTSPSTLLQVKGNGNNMISVQYASDGGAAGYGFYNSAGVELWSIGGGRFVAQDAFEISRQGSLKFLINSSGNVGIGTASPTARLTVAGQGTGIALIGDPGFSSGNYTGISLNGSLTTVNYNILSSPTDSTLYINRPSGVAIRFRESNGADQMIIQSGGNVGIGTTAPGAKLDIVSTTAGSEGLRVDGAGGGFAFVVKAGSDYTSHIRAGATIGVNYSTTPPSNGLIVEGNVGIGTTTPTYTLDITGAIIQTARLNSVGTDTRLYFHNTTTGTTTSDGLLIGMISSDTYFYNYENGNSIFGTNNVERMRIASGGNVLIGTTTDAGYKLQVNGDELINNGNLYVGTLGSSYPALITNGGPNDAGSYYGWGQGNGSWDSRPNANVPYIMNWHTGLTFSANSYYGGIRFYNQGYPSMYSSTLVMSVVSDAVGIGTTSPTEKVDIRGVIRVSNNGVNDSGIIAFGNYLNGAGYYDNGIFRSSLNSISTSGNTLHIGSYEALAFTTSAAALGSQAVRMYISGSTGNVLIGTTTDAGYTLDVNGTGRFNGTVSNLNNLIYSGGSLFLRNPANTFDWALYQDSGNNFRVDFNGSAGLILSSAGNLTVANLSGSGTRMVVADSAGTLSTQSIPGGVSGSGTTSYVPKWTSSSALGNSLIYDDGTNVGIGTTNPTGQMSGTTGLGIFHASYPALGLRNASYQWLNYLDGSYYKFWNAGAGDVMHLTYGGNVLIGTTTDNGAKLQVNGTGRFSGGIVSERTIDALSGLFLRSNIDGSSILNNGIILGKSTSSNDAASIVYTHVSNGSSSNRLGLGFWNADNLLNLTASGNVGIGTTSPSAKLEVVSSSLGSTQYNYSPAQIISTYTGNSEVIEFGALRTSNGSDWTSDGFRIQEKVDSTWMGYIQFNGSGNNGGLSFGAGLSSASRQAIPEAMRIASSGNVLIGTTTDAGYKLQVAGTGYVSSTLQVGGGAYNGYTLQVEGPATFGDTVIQNLPANGNALGGITSYQSQSNLTYNFSNGNYSGETITGFVLTDVYAGQIVALRPSAQLWQKADASVNGPLGYNMLGIVCYDATSGNSTTILLNGFFASNSYYSSSPQFGSPMYLSPTIQGNAEDTAPSTTGNIVRIVGHINEYSNANGVFVLRFNPDNFWLVI